MNMLYNKQAMECVVKIIINNNGEFCLGPGIIRLLKEVDTAGSIAKAAKNLDISYSKAWKMVRHAESGLGERLVERNAGGARQEAHAILTEKALSYIRAFEKTSDEIEAFAKKTVLENFA